MVEVGVGVKNVADGESELVHLVENSLVRSTGIDDDGLLRHWISNDRTIATQWRDGKCFSNHRRHDERMLPSTPLKAQATASLLVLPEPEWSRRLPYRTISSFVFDGDTTRGIPLRCHRDVGLRHISARDRCEGFLLRERRPDDPGPTALELVSHGPL